MKKTALVLSIVATLASCGGSTQQDCVDCATDSTAVVDTTAVSDSVLVSDTAVSDAAKLLEEDAK